MKRITFIKVKHGCGRDIEMNMEMSSAILRIVILALLRTTLRKTEGWRGLCFDVRA